MAEQARLPLSERRRVLVEVVKPNQYVALSAVSDRSAAEMLKFARTHAVEGLIAKRAHSVYQPGKRTGLWMKYRINLGQEIVVGGYIPGHLGVDSVVVGFCCGKDLIYAARVRAGLVPRTRREVFEKIGRLKIAKCPFVNLPETEPGRWGQGLTAEKMKECIWLLCRIRHRYHNVECRTMPYENQDHTNKIASSPIRVPNACSIQRPVGARRSLFKASLKASIARAALCGLGTMNSPALF